MADQAQLSIAPDGTLVCVCGNRGFYTVPDGASSYLLECPACGRRSEISAGPGNVTLTLVEVAGADEHDKKAN